MKTTHGYLVLTQAQPTSKLGWLLSHGILKFTQEIDEPPSEVSHAAVTTSVYEWNDIRSIRIVEQTWPKQIISYLQKYLDTSRVIIYRHRWMPQESANRIREGAWAGVGKRYGVIKILWFMFNALLSKVISWPVVMLGKLLGRKWHGIKFRLFSRLARLGPVVCSQMVAKLYSEQGICFGNGWETMTPDDLHDWVKTSPDWELVYDNDKQD